MNQLKFSTLREAVVARIPLFKNAKGVQYHKPDGSDWSLSTWSNALCGEVGEAAIIKKIDRGDVTLDDVVGVKGGHYTIRTLLAKELADVQSYLACLAFRAGVDLGQATVDKFNEISRRVDVPVRIADDGSCVYLTSEAA